MWRNITEKAKETGTRVLNPVTEVYLGENSVFTLDTAQIKGVDSTVRENNVYLEANSKLYVIEKLMTHGNQEATSNMMVEMNGEGSSAQIVSRSVAKGSSRQIFHQEQSVKSLPCSCTMRLYYHGSRRSQLYSGD